MKIAVHLYSNLQRYAGNQNVVETTGSTVGECLADLVHQYPPIGQIILDQAGRIFSHVFVSVNLESPKAESQERQLVEGDRVYIILIVAGG